MQFFLPLATNPVQAERIHVRIADRLKELGYQLTPHRIFKLVYERKGQIVSDAVGAPAANGEIVIAIFKNDVGYFICTYSQGAVGGEPLTVRYANVIAAEDFDTDEFDQKPLG